jgi:hypothetical protein
MCEHVPDLVDGFGAEHALGHPQILRTIEVALERRIAKTQDFGRAQMRVGRG